MLPATFRWNVHQANSGASLRFFLRHPGGALLHMMVPEGNGYQTAGPICQHMVGETMAKGNMPGKFFAIFCSGLGSMK